MQSVQAGMSEGQLQEAAMSSLREIFSCGIEVSVDGRAQLHLMVTLYGLLFQEGLYGCMLARAGFSS